MNGVMVIPAARGAVIGAAMLLLATGAQAVPLSYDEATDGDLQDPPPVLSLDVGDNIVTGASLPFDLDSFDIQVAAGQRLTAILFSITTADLTLDPWVHYIFNGTSSAALYLPLDGASMFNSDLPLGAGTYSMLHSGGQWAGIANTYTWTFRVEAVPEPATLALLGMGMVAAGLIRRRR